MDRLDSNGNTTVCEFRGENSVEAGLKRFNSSFDSLVLTRGMRRGQHTAKRRADLGKP